MRRKKFLSGIFLLSWLAVFLISGSLEQGRMTCGQAAAVSAANFAVMAYSGFGSGLLVLSDINNKKSPYRRQNGTGSRGNSKN